MVKSTVRMHSPRNHARSRWARLLRTFTQSSHQHDRGKKMQVKKADTELVFFKDLDELEAYMRSLHP